MLSINMSDVIGVLESCKAQLIFFGVVLVLAVIAMIVCRKMDKAGKFMVRAQSVLAILLALVIAVNLICFGPMSTMITLATGSGTISEETSAEATELVSEIAKEGIVLLKNEDNLLPLSGNSSLNVFGWASTNPCYGGTGSGALNDAYHTVTLLEGLENAGFSLNTELSQFYTDYRADRPVVGMSSQDWTLPEPPADTYSDTLISNAQSFSDTAMVVITRVGGEGADLPTDMAAVIDGSWNDGTSSYNSIFTNNSDAYDEFEAGQHYLELSHTEKDMLDLVCSSFDNVVLVYNGANTMELGFVDDYPQIKSVLWCPGTGQSGFNALGEILSGAVNPSGKTADTFVYDLTATPTWNNFFGFVYDNMSEFAGESFGSATSPSFVNYVEGIYVGYRFYETAATEGLIDYDTTVQYPFGYGLSYTTFSQEMAPISVASDGTITVEVTVTNTGDVAGKDVVEIYYNPPYTNGGIEKASANLITFGKTQMLEPGASETLSFTFNQEDMASYDTYGAGCYVLEAGAYVISINADSHTVLDAQTYTVNQTITYDQSNPRSTDQVAAVNQFADVEGNVTYLSRADGFANYAEATAAPASLTMPEDQKAAFLNNSNYDPNNYNNESDVAPTTGASNGLSLVDLRGVDYDDPQWDSLLDQLTVTDMSELIAMGGYQTAAAKSVDKVNTYDCDGPASINNNFTQVGSVGFPSAVMIASTWSQELALEFGRSIGKMADEMDTSGWYAPAMNTHRSAFAGRNFEYYSEDGVLSGKIASQAIQGAKEYGVYAYMKHFALNDQEARRCEMLCTWSNEQAIREIYLKPFEISVKEGGCQAVMSSFNYVGTTWAGGCNALCNVVLRDEWGFVGMVLTDYFGVYGYMNSDQAIRNGTDFCLVNYPTATNYVKDSTSATSLLAMRQACKNILYTVVNSRAYAPENLNTGMPGWQIAFIVVDVILAAAFVALEVGTMKKYGKKRASAAAAK